MSLNWPKSGVNNVAEFQTSGHTFVVTGSNKIIKLKYVASEITLSATSDANFTIYDPNHEAFAFPMKASTTAHFKGKFLTFNVPTNMSALVALTNVPSGSYIVPSGSQFHRV